MMAPTQPLDRTTSGEIIELATARAKTAEAQKGSGSLDHYEVVAPIARGGMGGVYLANDRRTGEIVALKLLDPRFANYPEIVERLFGERVVSERAKHVNLVDVRAATYSEDGVPYLVIEYLDGENLGALAERGRMESVAVIGICLQVACGIAAMHAAGVVHCDLKPDNIFVLYEPECTDFPHIKVIDYGVSHVVGSVRDESTIAGTPACMAPEQWRGQPTPATDVYALGCLLFELLTGDSVFNGTLPELMVAHTKTHPPRASWQRDDVSPVLDSLIAQALAKNPELRPTMREMIDTLADLLPGRALAAVG